MCSCRAGFTGLTCETDVNDCSPSKWPRNPRILNYCNYPLLSNTIPSVYSFSSHPFVPSDPCLSGGSCRDSVNSFYCSCLAGFTGPRCALEINECQSSPCKNGATCTDYVNSYTCTCRPGFTGMHCETNIPDCTERLVSAHCTSSTGSYTHSFNKAMKLKSVCAFMSAALASTEERAQIKSMAILVPAAQASLAPIANTRSMSVTPSPASTEASVKMPWSPSVAPALRVTLVTAARYTHTLTGFPPMVS